MVAVESDSLGAQRPKAELDQEQGLNKETAGNLQGDAGYDLGVSVLVTGPQPAAPVVWAAPGDVPEAADVQVGREVVMPK